MISIVTASYQQGGFLERCIRSVAEQCVDAEVEHLIVDGGSDDETLEVIRRHEEQIDWWCSEPDDGPAAALNKGIRRASGGIVGCLNADDFFLPGALAAVRRAFARQPEADVVYGHGLLVDEKGRTICRIYSDRWHLERALYGRCPIVQQGTFYRIEAFEQAGGFNESNRTCWDGELLVDMAVAGAGLRRVDQVLGAFRIHGGSITGSGLGEVHRKDRERIRRAIVGEQAPLSVGFKRRWLGLQRLLDEPGLAARRAWARFRRWWHGRSRAES